MYCILVPEGWGGGLTIVSTLGVATLFVCSLARSHHMLVGIPSKKKDLEEAYATPTASHLRQSESGML